MDVLWFGDPGEDARSAMAAWIPPITVITVDLETASRALWSSAVRPDILVIDSTLDGLDVPRLLTRLESERVDLPIVLLTPSLGSDRPAPPGSAAPVECVVKTEDFVPQLRLALDQARTRHDLLVQLRASRRGQDRLRTILEYQPAVTCAFGPDGILTAMNQAGLTLLDATRELVVGQPVSNFVAADEQQAVADLLRRVSQGEPAEVLMTLVRPDGHQLQAQLRAVPNFYEGRLVALASLERREDVVSTAPTAAHGLVDDTLQTVSAERDSLTSELRDATAEIDQLRTAQAEWATTRAKLEAQLRESAEWAAALAQSRSELEALRAERERGNDEHATSETALRRHNDELAADLLRAHADLEQVRAEHSRLASGVEAYQWDALRPPVEPADWFEPVAGARDHEPEPSEPSIERERQLGEDIQRSDALNARLIDEREQLTRVVHLLTGRCQEADTDIRGLRLAVRDADARHRADASTIATLQTERDAVQGHADQVDMRLEQVEATLADERVRWTRDLEAAMTANGLLTRALEAESARAKDLDSRLAAARSVLAEWTTLPQSLAADHEAVLALHAALAQALGDAWGRCDELLERLEAALKRCAELQARGRG